MIPYSYADHESLTPNRGEDTVSPPIPPSILKKSSSFVAAANHHGTTNNTSSSCMKKSPSLPGTTTASMEEKHRFRSVSFSSISGGEEQQARPKQWPLGTASAQSQHQYPLSSPSLTPDHTAGYYFARPKKTNKRIHNAAAPPPPIPSIPSWQILQGMSTPEDSSSTPPQRLTAPPVETQDAPSDGISTRPRASHLSFSPIKTDNNNKERGREEETKSSGSVGEDNDTTPASTAMMGSFHPFQHHYHHHHGKPQAPVLPLLDGGNVVANGTSLLEADEFYEQELAAHHHMHITPRRSSPQLQIRLSNTHNPFYFSS